MIWSVDGSVSWTNPEAGWHWSKWILHEFPPFLCRGNSWQRLSGAAETLVMVPKRLWWLLDTEYDQAKVPPYNGNDPQPSPGESKSPSAFTPLVITKYKTRGRKRYKQGTTRNFLHSFPLSGTPVVQSYWAWNCSGAKKITKENNT